MPRPPSIRRQHRYTITFRTKHDSTARGVSLNLSSCASFTTVVESHSRRVFHPSMTRLPREIDVISLLRSCDRRNLLDRGLEERVSSSRFFFLSLLLLFLFQRKRCFPDKEQVVREQGEGRKRDTPRVSDVASNF